MAIAPVPSTAIAPPRPRAPRWAVTASIVTAVGGVRFGGDDLREHRGIIGEGGDPGRPDPDADDAWDLLRPRLPCRGDEPPDDDGSARALGSDLDAGPGEGAQDSVFAEAVGACRVRDRRVRRRIVGALSGAAGVRVPVCGRGQRDAGAGAADVDAEDEFGGLTVAHQSPPPAAGPSAVGAEPPV